MIRVFTSKIMFHLGNPNKGPRGESRPLQGLGKISLEFTKQTHL